MTAGDRKPSVYSRLRKDIIDLKMKPGMFFTISELCKSYNIGRSPAREALIQLQQDGLTSFLPQHGTMVSLLDLKKINDEQYIRWSVEENVMNDFIASFSDTTLLRLSEMVEEQNQLAEIRDIRGFADADNAFHSVFYQETGHQHMLEILERESGNYRRLRLLSLLSDDKEMERVLQEHKDILSAVSLRDAEKVSAVLYAHLGRIKNRQDSIVRRFPDLFVSPDESGTAGNDELRTDFLVSIRGKGM